MEEIKLKVSQLKRLTEELHSESEKEPFIRGNVRAISAHVHLLCNELELDIEDKETK